MRNRPCRALSAVLAALLPASGMAQALSLRAVEAPARLGGAFGPAGDPSSGKFLQALNEHLEAVSLLLPSALETPAGQSSLASYLAKAALSTPAKAAERSARAEAARLLASALTDPGRRREVVEGLLRQGSEGISAAEKLEALAPAASSLASLRRLGEDFRKDRPGERLEVFFSGARMSLSGGAAQAPAAESPEVFAEYAERRFHPGLLGGRSAVAAPSPAKTGFGPESAPSEREMSERVELSPLTNPERERLVVELFEKAGAKPEEIFLQDAGLSRHNIFVVKKGRGDRVVVVGGHHDMVNGVGSEGVIDNWTGATMVVNLYQALRGMDTEATYVFIAFAREEEGLIGSKKFVKSLAQAGLDKVDAMINLDTLAVDGTYSWKNNSTKSLLERVKAVAGEKGLGLSEVSFWGGDADSSPFRKAGVPAMTLFGASLEKIFEVIHGPGDSFAAFSLKDYANAFHLTLALLGSIDLSPIRLPGGLGGVCARLAGSLLN